MTIKTFKRHEIKFLMSDKQAETIRQALLTHEMVLDQYCQKNNSYMIYNIYFDTNNNEIIRRSLSKPFYKEKLRLRSYVVPTHANDTVFLEIKKKIGGIVAKRRASLTFQNAFNFIEKNEIPLCGTYEDQQVMREIVSFQEQYHARPKVFISYKRVAYFGANDPDFRISFDQDILTRRNNVTFADYDFGSRLLRSDQRLMEIKVINRIPLWLCDLLSELSIYKTNFSKYGMEYKQYLLENLPDQQPISEKFPFPARIPALALA